jgi:predicted metalloprotease with PDZ domain
MLRHNGRCPLCRTTITSCIPPLIDCTGFPNAFYIELVRTTDDERFGISIETDMTVTRVERDSIAYAAGVRCKNIVLEVNGIPGYNKHVVTAMIQQQGVFRIWLHRKPEVMRSSP